MINLYIGHDPRETIGTHVFIQSVLKHSSVPVSFTPLHKPLLRRAFGGDVGEGTNAFTMSRFLIPFLQDWKGTAVFMDGADMLMRWDIADLEALRDPYKAVQVVKHSYETKHPIKYRGTHMESENIDYARKNWASVMLINCSHYAWRRMTPSYLLKGNKLEALSFAWCPDQYIGDLPVEWNWLVEHGKNDLAKVLHFSLGVPAIKAYDNDPHADEWFDALREVNYATD